MYGTDASVKKDSFKSPFSWTLRGPLGVHPEDIKESPQSGSKITGVNACHYIFEEVKSLM